MLSILSVERHGRHLVRSLGFPQEGCQQLVEETKQPTSLRLFKGFQDQRAEGGSSVEQAVVLGGAPLQSQPHPGQPEVREPLQKVLYFIRARQKPGGTFERSWSLCETYSIFRVNLALNSCRGLDDEVEFSDIQQKSLDYLLGNQHEDGGWGQTSIKPSDALSTAYALLSLALLRRHVPPDRIARALKYMLSQQNELTGEFVSVPDVVGPRPIVFDIPLLSTIFPVMALRILEQL